MSADTLATTLGPSHEPHAHPVSGRRGRLLRHALRYLALAVALVFFLFPIVWMVSMRFKLPGEYLHNPPVLLPQHPTLNHYVNVMQAKGWQALGNSIAVAVGATLLTMAIGSLAAYSLTRFGTGGRHLAFWFLSQRLMPPVVLVVPFFLVLRGLGQVSPAFGLDSRGALIALYTVFNLPYVIWTMRSYFASVPVEVEESGLLDGLSRLGVFWRMTLPMSLPGLIATATFTFIFSWTEFLFAVIFTRTKAFTLPVAIAGYTGAQGSNWGQAMALSTVATLPVLLLGLLVQRHFVRGLTLGAVRG